MKRFTLSFLIHVIQPHPDYCTEMDLRGVKKKSLKKGEKKPRKPLISAAAAAQAAFHRMDSTHINHLCISALLFLFQLSLQRWGTISPLFSEGCGRSAQHLQRDSQKPLGALYCHESRVPGTDSKETLRESHK